MARKIKKKTPTVEFCTDETGDNYVAINWMGHRVVMQYDAAEKEMIVHGCLDQDDVFFLKDEGGVR